MNKYIFIVLSLLISSCTANDRMKTKYEAQYLDIKTKINTNRNEIELMLSQLPKHYQVEMKKSMDMVQENDINGFLKVSKLNEKNFALFLESVHTFMGRLDTARSFSPNASQRQLYKDLRAKVLESRTSVEKYLSKPANPNDINELTSKNFLKKILRYDIQGFLDNSVITEAEFDVQIKEFYDNWDQVVLALIMADFNKELDAIMK